MHLILSLFIAVSCSWGFYAHQLINCQAVYSLPPSMLKAFLPLQPFLREHATDPDKRRYMVAAEGSKHYIDLDHYGKYPFDSLPRAWNAALSKFGGDSLRAHGIVPWWIVIMQYKLSDAFKNHDAALVRKLAAELGHYIADAHVPLHISSNHNGQKTGQEGIHGFWESRVPELLAATEWNFLAGRAVYLDDPPAFFWKRVLQSAALVDSVLNCERRLTQLMGQTAKYAFEYRNGKLVRQYAAAFTQAYDRAMHGMVEERLKLAIQAVASSWYTAWVDAGQPDLGFLSNVVTGEAEQVEFRKLDEAWLGREILGRPED